MLATDTVKLQVGGVQLPFTVLGANGITQECLLGADFLMQRGCLVDQLFIGGASVPLQASETRNSKISSCHVSFAEEFIVPPLHEVQFPVQLTRASTGLRDSREGLVHLLLGCWRSVAVHSLSAVHNCQVLTRILNPAPFPVTIRKNERIGMFHPIV